MENKKSYGEILFLELVYAILMIGLAAASTLLQLVWSGYENGNGFEFNFFFWLLGLGFFVGGGLLVYKFLLRKLGGAVREKNSPGLTGLSFLFWLIVGGIIFFVVASFILNQTGFLSRKSSFTDFMEMISGFGFPLYTVVLVYVAMYKG